MKHFFIFLIKIYQSTPLASHSMCRYTPTCSNYMIDAINEHGCIKGIYLGIRRILRCRPGGGEGFDPVPTRRIKWKENYLV